MAPVGTSRPFGTGADWSRGSGDVPSGAIVERDGRSMVFTIEGDHAHATPVTPGQTYGDLRLVGGLASGARIVRAPPAEMTDGARIVINKP